MDRVHTFIPQEIPTRRDGTHCVFHRFNLFIFLKLKFCRKTDDRMRILTKVFTIALHRLYSYSQMHMRETLFILIHSEGIFYISAAILLRE